MNTRGLGKISKGFALGLKSMLYGDEDEEQAEPEKTDKSKGKGRGKTNSNQ